MRGRAGKLVGTVVGATAVVLALAGSAAAEPFPGANQPPDCKLTEGVLTLDPHYWQPRIERRGDEIVVGYKNNSFVHCKPMATVTNTDTVRMGDESGIDLTGGPFAPGKSPEADGSPEIEFEIGPSIEYPVDLDFGPGDDYVTAGVVDKGTLGVNLNPSTTDTDADVLLKPDDRKELGLSNATFHMGAGNDTIDMAGGNGFAERTNYGVGSMYGDAGNDVIFGSASYDAIDGGTGSDRIVAGPGRDYVDTRDKSSDQVDCGSGTDSLHRDARDRGAKSCERSVLPSQDPPPLPPPHLPHRAGGKPQCSAHDAVMTIEPGIWQPTLRREGDRIVASYAKGEIPCGPVEPTVTNTDTINFEGGAEGTIDLSGGPFAPGLTDEGDGSSEIEMNIPVGALAGGPLSLILTKGADHVTLGSLPHRKLGINLNADEASPDADLRLYSEQYNAGLPIADLAVKASGGDDVVEADGGKPYVKTWSADFLQLRGGAGDDRISGSNSADILFGGSGKDEIRGLAGNDAVGAFDLHQDTVDCGQGKDYIAADPKDRLKACELKVNKGGSDSTFPPPAPPGRHP